METANVQATIKYTRLHVNAYLLWDQVYGKYDNLNGVEVIRYVMNGVKKEENVLYFAHKKRRLSIFHMTDKIEVDAVCL